MYVRIHLYSTPLLLVYSFVELPQEESRQHPTRVLQEVRHLMNFMQFLAICVSSAPTPLDNQRKGGVRLLSESTTRERVPYFVRLE